MGDRGGRRAFIAVRIWRELRLDPASRSSGERLELIPEGVLWFGSAGVLENRFVDLLAPHSEARSLVVRIDRLGRIDLTGASALGSLHPRRPRRRSLRLGRGLARACRQNPAPSRRRRRVGRRPSRRCVVGPAR